MMGFAGRKHSTRGNLSYPRVAEGCLFNYKLYPLIRAQVSKGDKGIVGIWG